MLRAFRGMDDIRTTYNLPRASRNIADRLCPVYRFFRQPRPHLNLEINAPIRCKLFQYFRDEQVFQFEYVMITRRKELYGDFRASMSNRGIL